MYDLRLLEGELDADKLATEIHIKIVEFLKKEREDTRVIHDPRLKDVITASITDYVKKENEKNNQEWLEKERKRKKTDEQKGTNGGC